MRFPKARPGLLALALLCGASLASAAPVTWRLSGVTFDDGKSASGSFSYDAGTDTLLSYSISVQEGALPAFTYTDGSAGNTCTKIAHGNDQSGGCNTNYAPNELFLGASDGSQFLDLYFKSALTDAGGTVGLLTSGNFQSYEIAMTDDYYSRVVTGGSVTTVPEPASLALLGIAFSGMFGAQRLRKQRKQ